MAGLKVTYRDPASLKPRTNNHRTHSTRQIKQIASSIEQFGFVSPVLIDQDGGIIAGHAPEADIQIAGP